MSGRVRSILLALFAVASWPPLLLHAQATAPRIVDIRGGFDGHFKVGCWTQFDVMLAGGSEPASGRLELTVADGDAVPSRVHAPRDSITLEPGATITVPLFARIGQLKSNATVVFRGDDGPIATREFSTAADDALGGILPSGRQLIVTLGGPLTASDELHLQQRNTTLVSLQQVDQLPVEWWGFEGVDAVILATADDEISTQLSTANPRMAALESWVRMGGRLIMSVGRQAERVLASGAPLASLAPGTLSAVVPLRQSTALETYADTSEPISSGAFLLQVPQLTGVRGKIEAYAGNRRSDLPLVVRTALGFGEVVFVAIDLERGPVVDWAARGQLFDKLLRRARRPTTEAEESGLGQVTTLGFVDLAGQLRGALDQFAGVQLVPFWLVAVLVAVYVLCIGPLDYYLVKRVLGRMEATWLTLALTVAVFCGGAYFLAYALKGSVLRANRVDLVDFDAETGLVRGTSWVNLFSPASEAYDLALDPAGASANFSAPPRSLFSWMGLPGDSFGGMNSSAGSMPLFTVAYDFSAALDRVERVPVAIWSTKAFVGRWWAEAVGPIAADLGDNGRLVGTLDCRLTEPLSDCVLIYGGWAYPLRKLVPGQHIDIASQLDPQTVETYLRHVRLAGDRDVAPPYDRSSFDIPRLIEIMSCHELAGGESYTGLTNQFQEFVDLSEAVAVGRAILIGRQAKTATRLVVGGEPFDDPAGQQWTYYRFVFPVKEQASP